MTTYEIGKSYVALVKEGRREECLSTLFSPDAVSVEAVQLPGRERTVKGLDALRGKSSGQSGRLRRLLSFTPSVMDRSPGPRCSSGHPHIRAVG
jgi:hypothetical protein